MNYGRNNIFIDTLCLFMLACHISKNGYILDFNPTNSSIALPPAPSFILPATNLFDSS